MDEDKDKNNNYDKKLSDNFVQHLENIRIAKKWSKTRLAQETGVDPKSVYNWANGAHSPNRKNQLRVCEALHVDPADMESDSTVTPLPKNVDKTDIEYFHKAVWMPDDNKAIIRSMIDKFINDSAENTKLEEKYESEHNARIKAELELKRYKKRNGKDNK